MPDFKLNLPQTDFPMKAELARREPERLARWRATRLGERILAARAGGPRFVLHDGPPYTSGRIHYGHILNKVLKDIVVKYRAMAGYHAAFVPGWDCHGLPTELQVERELGPSKGERTQLEIRALCHDHAMKAVAVQRADFERLGVFGSFADPYLTLDKGYEATIARELAAFARGGYLYRGKKPVHWCVRCATALAEAEVEHRDKGSPSIHVAFPAEGGGPRAYVIWTTTPWTLPANQAIAYLPSARYVALRAGDRELVVAEALADALVEAAGLVEQGPRTPVDVAGGRAVHPLDGRVVPLLPAEHVTLDAGTGLVHTAPGHGQDDYRLGQAHGLPPFAPVDAGGRFTDEVPAYQGLSTDEANPRIMDDLAARGALLARGTLTHAYPHCWRCKRPVLFRATPQWFVALDHQGLRRRALDEIERTRWIPPWGENRIHGMIEHRPDWCLSRQRVWGVPLPVFYCVACAEPLVDGDVIDHVADLFEREGADAWFARPARELVPPGTRCGRCGSLELRKEQDIVDVWFESGVSWAAVCERRPELLGRRIERDEDKIDLYLEGSDQHRGWFHSSLLAAVATRGRAPYKAVLTHGFVLDSRGRPLSKSDLEQARREGRQSDYIEPERLIAEQGAEVLRLWVASEDYRGDVVFSREHLAQLGEAYRKVRNTCRFLLGNLFGFRPDDHAVAEEALPELDRYALDQARAFAERARRAYEEYELHLVYRALVDYCAVDLSAFYFDVIKDRLYCDAAAAPRRRATQTVLDAIARILATTTAPILAFTAEEVWEHLPRRAGDPDSVHLARLEATAPAADAAARAARAARWGELRELRAAVQEALEPFRREKRKSLHARITLRWSRLSEGARAAIEAGADDLAEALTVSSVVIDRDAAPGPLAVATPAPGSPCPRCWRVVEAPGAAGLCDRCAGAMEGAR